ncbi:MAG: hypothetical protein LUC86_00900 [Prevotellaceae bacterium]|nr:hypothetical protein [Prevotellaceae bacterium]MCD8303376.1 hypothetical protein [Prevotellaceae bacterium]
MIFLTVNLTSWSDRWALAGISVLTVFVILIILVAVLQIFSTVAKKGAQLAKHGSRHEEDLLENATQADKAAVAIALHLYLSDQHDVESGVLTINNDTPSPWQFAEQNQ